MNKYIKLILSAFIISLIFIGNNVYADERYSNEDTGYKVYIDDYADLLTDEEEEKLKDDMIKVTEYANVAFVTSNEITTDTDTFAKSYYITTFGDTNVKGTMFVIDMNNRWLLIRSNGGIDKIITNAKSDIITDNNYRAARAENYYECAKGVYDQIYTLLDGGKISEPMRHISNVLMAIALSVLLGYLIVSGSTKVKKQIELKNYASTFALANANATFIGDHKVYCPPSDSGGGGSSGGGGGGGGGGGSGGGHGF